MSADQCDRCGHGMDLHKQLHEHGQFVTYCVDDEYGAGDDWQCGCRFETPGFVVCCDTCHDAGVRYRIRENCSACAETSMQSHRQLHPGHVVTLSRTVEPPPFRDARTSRLTQRRGW